MMNGQKRDWIKLEGIWLEFLVDIPLLKNILKTHHIIIGNEEEAESETSIS